MKQVDSLVISPDNSFFCPDSQGIVHVITWQGESLLFDGKQVSSIKYGDHSLQVFAQEGTPPCSIEPTLLGQAYFGTMPSYEQMGELLAAYLEVRAQLEQVTAAFKCVSTSIELLHTATMGGRGAPTIPRPIFDDLTLRVLSLLDGSEKMVDTVSRLLNQPRAVITAWASQYCFQQSSPSSAHKAEQLHIAEDSNTPVCEEVDTIHPQTHSQPPTYGERESCTSEQESSHALQNPSSPKGRREKFWTEERLQLLDAAFMSSAATTVIATCTQIAEHYGWDAGTVSLDAISTAPMSCRGWEDMTKPWPTTGKRWLLSQMTVTLPGLLPGRSLGARALAMRRRGNWSASVASILRTTPLTVV